MMERLYDIWDSFLDWLENKKTVLGIVLVFLLSMGFNRDQAQITFDAQKAKITGIENHNSSLEKEESRSGRFFDGTICLIWDEIPNASGYQIEFNFDPMMIETDSADLYLTGGFYSYDVDISKGIQFRIRAYGLQGNEKVYGEFSEWETIKIE